MTENANSATNLPFPRYRWGQIQDAFTHNQLDKLDWNRNADGNVHGGIGRIYVSMPDPVFDVVVQADNPKGPYMVFPASNWQHQAHPAQARILALMNQVASAGSGFQSAMQTNLLATGYIDEHVVPADPIAHEMTMQRICAAKFQSQREAMHRYCDTVSPIVTQVAKLAANYGDVHGMTQLSEQLRRKVDLMQKAIPLWKESQDNAEAMFAAIQTVKQDHAGKSEPEAAMIFDTYKQRERQSFEVGLNYVQHFSKRNAELVKSISAAIHDIKDAVNAEPTELENAMYRQIEQTRRQKLDPATELYATLDNLEHMATSDPQKLPGDLRPRNGITWVHRVSNHHDPEIPPPSTQHPER